MRDYSIGFASIVASRLCRCVYATDSDKNALVLTQKNVARNLHGDIRPRFLDWDNSSLISIAGEASAAQFAWISTDRAELEDLTIIIASDVFYDDASTLQFLRALRRLMLQYNRAKGYVATERRSVFSAAAMRVVSLGYDTFQDRICFHDPSTCHTYVTENQVRCRMCIAESLVQAGHGQEEVRFVVHDVQTSDILQRFKYDRISSLMLWKIDAVKVLTNVLRSPPARLVTPHDLAEVPLPKSDPAGVDDAAFNHELNSFEATQAHEVQPFIWRICNTQSPSIARARIRVGISVVATVAQRSQERVVLDFELETPGA
ncbi:S-adenosyl-L-methionine-dependent methyltransferase [Phytophthora cactorum]|nr:S-adenosyl-L-methionine-dependent methyltransferase [Phytophthora cactorum]